MNSPTQTETEDFHPEFIAADKAVELQAFRNDREIASRALLVTLVLATGSHVEH